MFDTDEVFQTLLQFDIVVPSLDAAENETFKKINLPHSSITVDCIIDNLIKFSDIYSGKLYLEVLFCARVNDNPENIKLITEAVKKIKHTKLQLGTISRPPAFDGTKALSDEEMLNIAKYFISHGITAEITVGFKELFKNSTLDTDLHSLIISLLKMRPCTLGDMVAVFGESSDKIAAILSEIQQSKEVITEVFNGETYYLHPSIRKDA